MKRLSALIIFLILLATACDLTPAPDGSATSSAPADGNPANLPLIEVVPTPKPARAVVTGVLMKDLSAPQPVTGVVLRLAAVHIGADGKPMVASLDRSSPLHTQSDRAGRFVFADVPPGQYALILDRVSKAYLLQNPKDRGDLLFEPKASQVLDLGSLVYATLP